MAAKRAKKLKPVVLAPEDAVPGSKQNRYPDEFIRQVRTLWASGLFKSDVDLAEYVGMPLSRDGTSRGSGNRIGQWRAESAPDGVSWQEFKDRIAGEQLQQAKESLLESFGEMNRRYLGALQMAFAGGVQTVLADREEIIIETINGPQKMRVPKVRAKNFLELVKGIESLMKSERLLRGAATERVEGSQRMMEMIVQAMVQAGFTEEDRSKVAQALDEMIGVEGRKASPLAGLPGVEGE